jgi:hypothetical protein
VSDDKRHGGTMKKMRMSKWSLLLVVVLLVCVSIGVAACGQSKAASGPDKMYTVTPDASSVAKSVSADLPAVTEDVKGWPLLFYSVPNTGIDFLRFEVGPKAENYPIHGGDDPTAWLGYVAKGYGEMILADSNKKEVSRIAYKEGDVIVCGPNAWHGWDNGDTDSVLLFMRPTPPPADTTTTAQ